MMDDDRYDSDEDDEDYDDNYVSDCDERIIVEAMVCAVAYKTH